MEYVTGQRLVLIQHYDKHKKPLGHKYQFNIVGVEGENVIIDIKRVEPFSLHNRRKVFTKSSIDKCFEDGHWTLIKEIPPVLLAEDLFTL